MPEGHPAHEHYLCHVFVEPEDLVLFLVVMEESVPDREEKESAGFGGINEEDGANTLNVCRLRVTIGIPSVVEKGSRTAVTLELHVRPSAGS
jgi:hypothetical protein